LLSQGERALTPAQLEELGRLMQALSARGCSHSVVMRSIAHATAAQSQPEHVVGEPAPARFRIRENGLEFEMTFSAGKSVGLFLDQRDNRRRCLTGHVAAGFTLFSGDEPAGPTQPVPSGDKAAGSRAEVLNTFAYTCGFSVCAAKAGARTTSLDLSKAHLEWGRRNFALNQLDLAGHEFIYGDVFDWLGRLGRKRRLFDVILLDPPTFSRSKASGVFRVERDLGKLMGSALRLLKPRGTLLVSSNAADWRPEAFRAAVEAAVRGAHRAVLQRHYVPQPVDFPICRAEPAYLKTMWLRVA
jgi:23S rRNA (cytosine1962-C5)-methyltransferase